MSTLLHRLFFVLAPAPQERNLIANVRDTIVGRTPVANDRLHLTLGITDDFAMFPDAIARRMLAIGDAVAVDPFSLSLDRLSAGAHSVALRPSHRCAGLAELQRQLVNDLKRWNLLRGGWAPSPHVTLWYWDGQPFLRPIPPITLDITHFVLIHSIVGATQHRVLARWTLNSGQQSFQFV